MTGFENFLINKDYIKHRLSRTVKGKFEDCTNKRHEITIMGNISYTYIRKDSIFHNKIKQGLTTYTGITFDDRANNEIIFGLNEVNKPPTLISPRPIIRMKKHTPSSIKGRIIEYPVDDNMMNTCLL